MKTTYIKSVSTNYFSIPFYYKVMELSKESTKTISLHGEDIDINEDESYFDQLGFITKTLCNGMYEEITREQFDAQYIKVINELNKLSAI